jgi:hypothetical protein
LATASERQAIVKAAVSAEKEARSRLYDLCRPEVRAAFPSLAQADEALKLVSHECFTHHLATLLTDAAGPAVARCVYRFLGSYESVLAEIGYQKAVYEALARVPPLAREEQFADREEGRIRRCT